MNSIFSLIAVCFSDINSYVSECRRDVGFSNVFSYIYVDTERGDQYCNMNARVVHIVDVLSFGAPCDSAVEGGSGRRKKSCYSNRPSEEKSFARGCSWF